MITLNISLPQLQLFFFVFIRVGAILMSIPVFDSKSIPLFFKIALAFATSIVLFPMLGIDPVPMATSVIALGVGVAGEILLGLAIGFSVKLIFAGVQLAGQLAGYQMGLALANVMDPSSSQQVPLLAQFNKGLGTKLSDGAPFKCSIWWFFNGAVGQDVRKYVRDRHSGGSPGYSGFVDYHRGLWIDCTHGSPNECIYCCHAVKDRCGITLSRIRSALFFSFYRKHIQRSGSAYHAHVKSNVLSTGTYARKQRPGKN